MAVFKCKSCGGTLEVIEGQSVVKCDYCDVVQSISIAEDDALRDLYEMADNYRFNKEFDKAEKEYEKIIEKDRTQADAYWGIILSRYGIEYVEDPNTHKKIPTCHRASFESVTADMDYKAALLYADSLQSEAYKKEAQRFDEIRKEILRISEKEKPYDVFICYKQRDDKTKEFTPDSRYASQVYHHLVGEGLKVFFAEVSLIDKAGTQYEPYIFAALHSAKVMIVMGTKPEYVEAVWVRNEWSRYLRLMRKDKSRMLIPCYKDMAPEEFPEDFKILQALNVSDIGFINNLMINIRQYVNVKPEVKKEEVKTSSVSGEVAPLLVRTAMYLEDGHYSSANEYCEKVLDKDPQNAQAYLYKMLAALKLSGVEGIANLSGSATIRPKNEFIRVKSCPAGEKDELVRLISKKNDITSPEAKDIHKKINDRELIKVSTDISRELLLTDVSFEFAGASISDSAFIDVVENNSNFKKFIRFASADEKANVDNYLKVARNNAIEKAIEEKYAKAVRAMNGRNDSTGYENVCTQFCELGNYKDSFEKAAHCYAKSMEAKDEETYTYLMREINSNDPSRMEYAYKELEYLADYKDVNEIRAGLPQRIQKAKDEIEDRRKDAEFKRAQNLSVSNNAADIRKSIEIFESLGNFKGSRGMVSVLVPKLQRMETDEKERALREVLKLEYEAKYPEVANKSTYIDKCNNLTKNINTEKSSRKVASPGCFSWGFLVSSIFMVCLGILAILEDEEDMIGFLIVGGIVLFFVLKNLIGKVSDRSYHTRNISRDERDLEIYKKKLAEINKMPTLEAYIEERKKALSKDEKGEREKPANAPAANEAVGPKAAVTDVLQTVTCKTCGGINTVHAGDKDAKCSHCGSNLK